MRVLKISLRSEIGITVIRFENTDVLNNIEHVLRVIRSHFKITPTLPKLAGEFKSSTKD